MIEQFSGRARQECKPAADVEVTPPDLDDAADEFLFELALVLRRILGIRDEEEEVEEEDGIFDAE